MRTTIKLADDVAAAVERLQRSERIGLSEALNRLARGGMAQKSPRKRFRQRTARMGRLLIDVTNVAEALETAEGVDHR